MSKIQNAIDKGWIRPKKTYYQSDNLIFCLSETGRLFISDGKWFHYYHIKDKGIIKLCKDFNKKLEQAMEDKIN